MHSRPGASAAALLAALTLFNACYRFVPPPTGGPVVGTRVETRLTDLGTVELARYVGPGAAAIEGRVLSANDSVITVGVMTVRNRNQIESFWAGEPVPVPRALIADIGVRELSRQKTGLAVAGVVGAAVLVAVGFVVIGNALSGGDGGGGNPTR